MDKVYIATVTYPASRNLTNGPRRSMQFAGLTHDAAVDKAEEFLRNLSVGKCNGNHERALEWMERYCSMKITSLPL